MAGRQGCEPFIHPLLDPDRVRVVEGRAGSESDAITEVQISEDVAWPNTAVFDIPQSQTVCGDLELEVMSDAALYPCVVDGGSNPGTHLN